MPYLVQQQIPDGEWVTVYVEGTAVEAQARMKELVNSDFKSHPEYPVIAWLQAIYKTTRIVWQAD